jgi:uroporphyrinogen-III decarboxylase
MMPLLDLLLQMQLDALETFTPFSMGGDVELSAAKKRIGDRLCMIGGFDQFHYLAGCPPEETRQAVRRCFEEAGAGGGYILAPSDHFFKADIACLEAFAEEARLCTYPSG